MVTQQHGQSIDADALAGGGRHAHLEGAAVVFNEASGASLVVPTLQRLPALDERLELFPAAPHLIVELVRVLDEALVSLEQCRR